MCKGHILEDWIKERGPYEAVGYTGDGTNDFCPMTKLRPVLDYAFVREGFRLKESLKKQENRDQLKCNVVYWSDISVVASKLSN